MEKNDISAEDLKILRRFMKSKNITYKELSKEMNYSAPHVIKVFNGACGISKKFISCLVKALQRILQKDLIEFYKLMKNTSWKTFDWN